MPQGPHDLPEERPQRAQVAVLLQEELQEDDGQAVGRLLPVRGEDHVEGGHVARVPRVGQLVEYDLLCMIGFKFNRRVNMVSIISCLILLLMDPTGLADRI